MATFMRHYIPFNVPLYDQLSAGGSGNSFYYSGSNFSASISSSDYWARIQYKANHSSGTPWHYDVNGSFYQTMNLNVEAGGRSVVQLASIVSTSINNVVDGPIRTINHIYGGTGLGGWFFLSASVIFNFEYLELGRPDASSIGIRAHYGTGSVKPSCYFYNWVKDTPAYLTSIYGYWLHVSNSVVLPAAARKFALHSVSGTISATFWDMYGTEIGSQTSTYDPILLTGSLAYVGPPVFLAQIRNETGYYDSISQYDYDPVGDPYSDADFPTFVGAEGLFPPSTEPCLRITSNESQAINTFRNTIPNTVYLKGADLNQFFGTKKELVLHVQENRYTGAYTHEVYLGDADGGALVQLYALTSQSNSSFSTQFGTCSMYMSIDSYYENSPITIPFGHSIEESYVDYYLLEHFASGSPSDPFSIGNNRPMPFTGIGQGEDFSSYVSTDEFINVTRPSWIPDVAIRNNDFWAYSPYDLPDGFNSFWGLYGGYKLDGVSAFDLVYANGFVPGTYTTDETLFVEEAGFGYYTLRANYRGPWFYLTSGSPIITPPTLSFNLGTVKFKYSTTRAPSNRRGVVIYRSSGSAQLSLEPVWPTSSWHLSGDVWFAGSTGSNRGLYVADYSGSTRTTGSIVPYRILASQNYDVVDGGEF